MFSLTKTLPIIAAVAASCFVGCSPIIATAPSGKKDDRSSMEPFIPETFVWNGTRLALSFQKIQKGDPLLTPVLDGLQRAADRLLTVDKGWNVLSKNFTPPSGDKHDFESVAIYYWPCNTPQFQPPPSNCNRTTGLPWVSHDGIVNNAVVDQLDAYPNSQMTSAVSTLSLAYYFTDNETYAEKAVSILSEWFINPETAMNPNLNFAAFRPGINNGSASGITGTVIWIELIDCLQILNKSNMYTAVRQPMLDWFASYADWLLTSRHGHGESDAKNNHGTWYDAQLSIYSLFTGNKTVAGQVAGQAASRRVDTQIEPDGQMPFEENRTKSLSYSFYNLQAFLALADLSLHSDVNLYTYTSPDGRSIRKAIDFMIPFVTGEKEWPFKQISPFKQSAFFQIFRRATYAYGGSSYENAIRKLPSVASDDLSWLLYPLNESGWIS